MRRRHFLLYLSAGAAALPRRLSAQTPPNIPRTARVGILSGASLSTPANAYFREAFVESLRQLGWEEGKNLIIEARAAEGRPGRFAELAADLVTLPLDVAVASNSQAIQALKDKTSTIPIVMLDASNPVEAGFIASLARPGGNITGVTSQISEAGLKNYQLLRELKPGLNRIGILYTPGNSGSAIALKQHLENVPSQLSISLVPVPIDKPEDIETAFIAIDQKGLQALHVHPTPVINTHRVRIAALLIERGLPTIVNVKTLVRDGILMSYGPDQVESWRGAAAYVGRILRGANPADLPVQQPTKFELVINLKTARALRLEIPPTLLARADEVIE